eukprot:jgi/Undpi1/11910/HiC_scaffold_4.g01609.m1
MKTLFGRGRPLLGAAAAVLLGGASTQQANAIIDIWEPFPGMMTSCSFSDDVDWSGTINFLNPILCKTPKVVHIRDDTAALVRTKNDVLVVSNVHFVVHHNAKLVLSGKHAISLDRDEEDRGGVVRLEELGVMNSPHDVRYTPNAIVIANAGAMPGKVR